MQDSGSERIMNVVTTAVGNLSCVKPCRTMNVVTTAVGSLFCVKPCRTLDQRGL